MAPAAKGLKLSRQTVTIFFKKKRFFDFDFLHEFLSHIFFNTKNIYGFWKAQTSQLCWILGPVDPPTIPMNLGSSSQNGSKSEISLI